MSRIAGIIAFDGLTGTAAEVESLLQRCFVHHDGKRFVLRFDGGALGLIGSATGHCMMNARSAVALDGYVYNAHELGNFESDAQGIQELYERYGFIEMLRMLNGDFAIALYDVRDHVLWLARDRFGVKPCYYVAKGGLFSFCSRPKPLANLPWVSDALNHRFIGLFAGSHYRSFDNEPDASPYRDIAQLPAAHCLKVSGCGIQKIRYWSLVNMPDVTEPEHELAEQYRGLLLDAVALRLRRAKRPAFTLSGGMDSSSVLACAVKSSNKKQHAFSTVYTDKTYDEADDIKPMTATHVVQWHQVRVDNPDVFAVAQKMIEAHDEPVATATWLSHFLLCRKAAAEGFKSLFGGLGGDELNAGEYEYFFYHFADLRRRDSNGLLDHEIAMWARYHDHPIYRKNHAVAYNALKRLTDPTIPGRCLPDRLRLERYKAALNPEFFDLSTFEPIMEHPFQSYLKNRTYQDLTRETIPCCLRAEDRQCAAFGLNNFVPFFDHRLVEFMFRVPGSMKIREGVTKRLLREAMKGILPEETRTRIKKTGWNAPAHVWFFGKGLEAVRDMVHSKKFQQMGIYNVPEVWRIIDEHERIVSNGTAAENHMMFLWQMVNLTLWLTALSKHAYYENAAA
ncbi:MAG: asparagine synthase-related protein [Desulfobacterota bacterium]|nr:asparagine synthase-related protein [Thermodesulfobacteriota bacterium]